MNELTLVLLLPPPGYLLAPGLLLADSIKGLPLMGFWSPVNHRYVFLVRDKFPVKEMHSSLLGLP